MNRASGSVVLARGGFVLRRLGLLLGLGLLRPSPARPGPASCGRPSAAPPAPRRPGVARWRPRPVRPAAAMISRWAWACCNDRSMVSRRLKLLAPAPARTRVPSWAIRLTVTSPPRISTASIWVRRPFERRLVLDPEVVEHVVVDRHRAAEPAVRVARPGRAAPVPGRRRRPEWRRRARAPRAASGRWPAAPASRRGPGSCSRNGDEVPGLDQFPDEAGVVVVGEQFVERAGPQEHLLAVGPPQPRGRRGAEVDRGPCRRLGALQVGK